MIKKLVIIGNGFDRWLGFPTSYESFRQYYDQHVDDIIRRLGFGKWEFMYEDGERYELSDVEIVYGDPLAPNELGESFWYKFEDSLGYINAEKLNLLFGTKRRNLKALRKCVARARRILNEAFVGWISSIDAGNDNEMSFSEDFFL